MDINSIAFSAFVCLMSLAAGMLGGMLGMAAGIFVVPALTLLFGVDIRYAVGASLVSVIACSCGSAASAMENRLTNVRLAILLEIGTTLGALTGVVLAGIFSSSLLYLLFSVDPADFRPSDVPQAEASRLPRISRSRGTAGRPACGSIPVIPNRLPSKKSTTA